jgi:hypothetical protein
MASSQAVNPVLSRCHAKGPHNSENSFLNPSDCVPVLADSERLPMRVTEKRINASWWGYEMTQYEARESTKTKRREA